MKSNRRQARYIVALRGQSWPGLLPSRYWVQLSHISDDLKSSLPFVQFIMALSYSRDRNLENQSSIVNAKISTCQKGVEINPVCHARHTPNRHRHKSSNHSVWSQDFNIFPMQLFAKWSWVEEWKNLKQVWWPGNQRDYTRGKWWNLNFVLHRTFISTCLLLKNPRNYVD